MPTQDLRLSPDQILRWVELIMDEDSALYTMCPPALRDALMQILDEATSRAGPAIDGDDAHR